MKLPSFVFLSFASVLVSIAVVGCSSDPEGPAPYAERDGQGAVDAGPDVSVVGTAQRRAKDQHCCYKLAYQRCPDAVACYGGVDLDACVAECAGDATCLTNTCTNRLRNAPAPVGCTPEQAPAEFPCDS